METLTLGTEEDLAELELRESLLNKRKRKSDEEEEYKEGVRATKKRQRVSWERYVTKQEGKCEEKAQGLTMRELLSDKHTI